MIPLGQVKSGKKYWSDGVPTAGQQFEYAFDDIGNRQTAASGGDQWGGHLRYQRYTANALNQYESRIVPGYVDVVGTAHSNATVTVNEEAAYRKGEYFRAELPLNNATGAVWLSITNLAVLNTTSNDLLTNILGHTLVAATPETFAYDADGNLTQDGKWNYTWDAENRLVAMTNIPSVPQSTRKALAFRYDWLGRRIEKTVYTNNGSAYFPNYTNRFIYDGWNLLAELNTPNSALRDYMWGLDLSGSLQGAGGVGGLLWMTVHGGDAGTYFNSYDGNGNVAALVRAADGAVAARCEYGPFGELLRATYASPLVRQSLGGGGFRFSTKYQDDETDLLSFGHRYYSASTGRWLSRDPLADYAFRYVQATGVSASTRTRRSSRGKTLEDGYVSCANNCTDSIDYLGLCGFGQAYAAQHPGPLVSHPIPSSKGGEQLCCVRQRRTPQGHSDFYGADEFHFEYYDIWNPPFPFCGDPSKHFGDRGETTQNIQQDINDCNARAFSADMHQLQDTYCHTGFQWDPCTCKLGHLWASIAGHDPDTLAETNGLWDQAQQETINWVTAYRAKCGWGEPVQLDPPYKGRSYR